MENWTGTRAGLPACEMFAPPKPARTKQTRSEKGAFRLSKGNMKRGRRPSSPTLYRITGEMSKFVEEITQGLRSGVRAARPPRAWAKASRFRELGKIVSAGRRNQRPRRACFPDLNGAATRARSAGR